MILTRRFGALRARRTLTDSPEVRDEREPQAATAVVESRRDVTRDTDHKAA